MDTVYHSFLQQVANLMMEKTIELGQQCLYTGFGGALCAFARWECGHTVARGCDKERYVERVIPSSVPLFSFVLRRIWVYIWIWTCAGKRPGRSRLEST